MGGVVLSNAMNATLLSLKNTSNLIDDVTLRLASGMKVSSALDNPQNFFASEALNNQAKDLSHLLDGISKSIRAIEQTASALESVYKLIDQAEEIALRRQADINAINIPDPIDGDSYLTQLIKEEGADFYYRLDDTDTGLAADDGDVGSSATFTAITTESDPLFHGANGSAYFNGINSSVSLAYNPQLSGNFTKKTIEFVFNASSTSNRQTIYSQGNTTRGLDIYIENNELYFTAVNSPSFGGASPIPQPVFKTTIEAGKTYHAALVFSRDENRLEAFLNGESVGSSEVGNGIFFGHNSPTIGRQNAATKTLHDGTSSSSNYYQGYISDVAIHNTILTDAQIEEHALAAGTNDYSPQSLEYSTILEQIQRIAIDSSYLGINLLRGQTLHTQFSASGKSFLLIDGIDLVNVAGGLPSRGFDDADKLDIPIEALRDFREIVRNYATTLSSDLNIIKIRDEFTQSNISTLEAGRNDLTLANQNQDGASLLALQTRQQLGVTALSLAAQSTQQTLRLF